MSDRSWSSKETAEEPGRTAVGGPPAALRPAVVQDRAAGSAANGQGAQAGGEANQAEAPQHVWRPRPPLSDDRSWSVQDVAYFLNVSESTVRNLERDRKLPALPRIGTRITFDPKVVRAFRDGWRPPPGRASGSPPMLDSRPAPHRQGR